MYKILAKSFILLFLLTLSCASFYYGIHADSSAAFGLCTAAALAFTAVYCAVALNYKVGGAQLSLEPRVQGLEQQTEELKIISTSLYKALHAISLNGGSLGGISNSQVELINSYLEPIMHLIPEGTAEQVAAEVKALRR